MAFDLSKPMSLHQQGHLTDAISLYDTALRQEPNNPDILYLTGLCRLQMGDMDSGAKHMRALVNIQPQNAAAHHALGKALLEIGKTGPGRRHLEQALAINPASYDSRIELAELALANGDARQAKTLYRDGLKIDPSQAALWNNLGTVFRILGQLEEAQQAWEKTVSLAPNLVAAYCNIATLKVRIGRFSEGITHLKSALEKMPEDPDLNYSLGDLLFFAGKFSESAASLEKAISYRPGFRNAEIRLAQARQYLCDWDGLEALIPAVEAEIAKAVEGRPCLVSPFFALTLPTTEAERTTVAAAEARKRQAQIEPLRTRARFSFKRGARSRIHIGYLSGDWRDHAASHLACDLFRHHDRNLFEISVLSFGPDDDSQYLHRIRNGAERFVDLSARNDLEAANEIHGLGVDILLDVQGFMGNARPEIWMLQPAPIQISYLTYLGSMGTERLDYIIADSTMINHENRRAFTESVITLPHCYQINDGSAEIGNRPSREDEGLPADRIVFCAIHGGHKITRDIFARWMRILTAVPESVLWLAASGEIRKNLSEAAATAGIDPDSRLVFARRLPDKADHIARLRLADLFLDTPIYGAHSSAVDCLWAGTPVLTAPSDVFSSRGAATLLKTMGIESLITKDHEEYERVAIKLAQSPEERAHLRNAVALSRDKSPLFNTARWVHDVESAYQEIWARYEGGQVPADITIR